MASFLSTREYQHTNRNDKEESNGNFKVGKYNNKNLKITEGAHQ